MTKLHLYTGCDRLPAAWFRGRFGIHCWQLLQRPQGQRRGEQGGGGGFRRVVRIHDAGRAVQAGVRTSPAGGEIVAVYLCFETVLC